jgi:hypothetical protein
MNWEDLVAPIVDAEKTPEQSEQMLQAMYRKYVGAEARDIQFEYFRTLQKRMKSSMLDHSSRMLTLAHYGNKLPGTKSPLTEQIKKCIFQSFPLLWQQQCICSGQCFANTPLSHIIEFMSNKKLFADMQNLAHTLDKKKPFNQKDDSSQGSFKKRKQRANVPHKRSKEWHGLRPDLECPIHGGHLWNKGFDNPQDDSYKYL